MYSYRYSSIVLYSSTRQTILEFPKIQTVCLQYLLNYLFVNFFCCNSNNAILAPCGFVAVTTSRSRNISSPMFPARYPAATKCEWILVTKHNSQVELIFQSFDTEKGFDYLEVRVYQIWNQSGFLCRSSIDKK